MQGTESFLLTKFCIAIVLVFYIVSFFLQYIIEEFSETVFSQLLRYLITGSCAIQPSTIVGITCTAEHYEIPELKQACFDRLPSCLTGDSVCMILTQLEKYLSYHCAKTMVVRALEFVDSNAEHVLTSEGFVYLSENMVHLILRRDIDVAEIVRVNAALAWGKRNVKQGTVRRETAVCACYE